MPAKRLEHIDFLRAIATVGMIVTHILSYRLGTTITNTVWNYLHFVVPLFIFCSGYISYTHYADTKWTRELLAGWYKKRLIRLLQPYVIFTAIHYAFWKLLPGYFSGLGLDYGWLVLLFVELMFVTPLYISAWNARNLRIGLLSLTFASTIVLLFVRPHINYQIYMWIPWSFIYLLSFYAVKQQILTKRYIQIAVGAFIFFVLGNWVVPHLGQPLTLTLHKYPPDIFYLSYGIGMGAVLLLIEPLGIFHQKYVTAVIRWISRYSYELFFAHYIVIDLVVTILRYWGK
jgi:peptidoglycan/LPS O-acetylase OafA/YrhL